MMKKNIQLNIAPFDASDYLDNEETIAEYLSVALKNPDPDAFLDAVRDVAKAQGISTVAQNAGVENPGFGRRVRKPEVSKVGLIPQDHSLWMIFRRQAGISNGCNFSAMAGSLVS